MSSPSNRTRALIIADSLALPRDRIAYEHTWPSLLADDTPDVTWINRAVRQSTTERLNTEGDRGGDCLEVFEPDLVILQLGICDCAPRVLHRRTAAIAYRLPFQLGTHLSSWLERRRGRKVENCFVPLRSFEDNLRSYLARAASQSTQVIALAVLPTSKRLSEKSPLINGQIRAYNATLDRLASEHSNLHVLYGFKGETSIDDLFVDDGYHLNGQGARLIVDRLAPMVRDVLTRRVAS